MLGLIIVVIGFAFVVAGTIMWITEPPTIPVPNCFCLRKEPIYCCKTLHGILFDAGWPLAAIGGLIMLICRKEKLWK